MQNKFHPQIKPESIARAIRVIDSDPYALLEFYTDNVLQTFINCDYDLETKDIDARCIICMENIRKGETVLLICRCSGGMCANCARGVISNTEGTYQKEPIGIKCSTCGIKTFYAVSEAILAQEHENSLIEIAESEYIKDEKKTKSSKYYIDFYHKIAERFRESYGDLLNMKNYLHEFSWKEQDEMKYSKKFDVLKCMIARLQACILSN